VTSQPAPDAGSVSGEEPLTALDVEPGHDTERVSELAPLQVARTVPALALRRWYCAEMVGATSQPCSTCSAVGVASVGL
jgi:hypothetical protein